MAAVTIILLVLGPLLAAAGTLGFWYVGSTAPDIADLLFTRRLATAGRWMTGYGLSQICAEPVHPGGIALAGLFLTVVIALASIITRANLQNVARGAAT